MNSFEIGKIAEEIAYQHETCLFGKSSKRIVRMVSANPAIGYDIEVMEETPEGLKFKAIEVKAWNQNGHFHISKNEVETLGKLGDAAWIYLVDLKKQRVIKTIQKPFPNNSVLEAVNFKYYY